MRKPTRSSLKNKLDKEISRIVRSRGSCAWCDKDDYKKLQAAHIFSRNNLAVRHDLLNIVCLCAGCHFKAHQNPILFTEFIREYLGEVKYENLKMRATRKKNWELWEMENYLEALKKQGRGE